MPTPAFSQLKGALPTDVQKPFVPHGRWALVIGVSGYSDEIGRLKYTAREARDFASALTTKMEFDPANVKLLADEGSVEEAPTAAHILSQLDQLLNDPKLDKGNLFVFYFSGHGVATAKGDFLLPADVKKDRIEEMGVPVKAVITRIVKAGLKNVLFISDACRAGTKNDFGVELTSLCHEANLAVLLGCAPGKRSYEYAELHQGAFTHFLLEGLQEPKLRDSSGALWASRLGQDVQKKVYDFTEPDHGKFAQVPTLWGDDSTLDVLLGAYPPEAVTPESLQLFRNRAGKLNREEYVASLTTYAQALFDKDRVTEAVEMLKVVEQLGELQSESRYLLGASLDSLGRSGEANRVYAPLLAMKNSYWKDITQTTSLSRAIDPADRVQSAIRLLNSNSEWELCRLCWLVIDQNASLTQKAKSAKRFAQISAAWPRRKFYAEAHLALTESRWGEALKLIDKAQKAKGTDPSDESLLMTRLQPLEAVGNLKARDTYLDQASGAGQMAGLALLLRSSIAKDRGDKQGSIGLVKRALKAGIRPEYLFSAVKIAGPAIGILQDEFLEAASKHPYSWRAHIVILLMKQFKGDANPMEEYLRGTRYVDDDLTFYSSIYDMYSSVMAEELALGTLKQSDYEQQINVYFLQLIKYAPRFGFDSRPWRQVLEYGMFAERSSQFERISRKYLGRSEVSMSVELRLQLILLAMNRGDKVRVESLMVGEVPIDQDLDTRCLMACYYGALGQYLHTVKLVAHLPGLSGVWADRIRALHCYLQARGGDRSGAKAGLAKPSKDLVTQAFQGLAWAVLGDWKKAEPLLAIQEKDRLWTFQFVQERATNVLEAHYRHLGKMDKVHEIAMEVLQRQPGNPMFDHYSFVEKPGVRQFAGSVQLRALMVDDEFYLKNMNEKNKGMAFSGSLKFEVDAKGNCSGEFKDDEGTGCKFKGNVDANGNLKGSGSWLSRAYTLRAKLPTFAMYNKYPPFKVLPQYFEFIKEDGYRVAIFGYPGGKLPG